MSLRRSKALALRLPGAAASLRQFASQASPVFSGSPNAPQLPPCDFIPPKYTGPSKDEILALRKQYLSPGEEKYTRMSREKIIVHNTSTGRHSSIY